MKTVSKLESLGNESLRKRRLVKTVTKKASYAVASFSVLGVLVWVGKNALYAFSNEKMLKCGEMKTRRKRQCGQKHFSSFWPRRKQILLKMH